jgi:hypothetical protein
MSSPHRRRELAAQFEAACLAEDAETARMANLSTYERIEEIADMHDVKAFLHELVERLGLD